jgi:CheY-like chemotaxis protein
MTHDVLVVDDDVDTREIVVEIIASLGLKARTANGGTEALQQIDQATPHLILLDIMMPGINGFGVLARLRSSPRTRAVPVVIVTACGINEKNSLRLPGVTDVLVKGTLTVESVCSLVVRTLSLQAAFLELRTRQ